MPVETKGDVIVDFLAGGLSLLIGGRVTYVLASSVGKRLMPRKSGKGRRRAS